jgi:hypothetical protein
MRKFIFSLFLLSYVFFNSCTPSVKDAIAYNDTIVAHHEEIFKKLAYLKDTYHEFIPEQMDSAYSDVMRSTLNGIDFTNKLEGFHGDESYKKTALSLFELYRSVIENEHARIVELFKLPTEKFRQKEIDEVDRLNEEADKKITEKIEEIGKIQAEFVKKYQFTIDKEKPDED